MDPTGQRNEGTIVMVYSQAKDMPCEMCHMQLLEGLSRSLQAVRSQAILSHPMHG